MNTGRPGHARRRTQQGMTLAEVLIAFLISGMAIAGIVTGYVFSGTSAQVFGLSMSANAQASQWMEQMRSAQWNTASSPVIDQLSSTNFSNEVVVLQAAANGATVVYGTNYATISTISTNPPLRLVRVDCRWNYRGTQPQTNTIVTCRAPDQ